jgi:pantoate--beta-alanine ligase
MQVIESIEALRRARAALTGSVGLVPTMGALHEGHLELVRAAKRENSAAIVTIFVNPTQFGANEDFSAYPRDLPADLAMLEREGVDLVFTPTSSLMYPSGYRTYIHVEEVTQGLEGERRPGHFVGVATVVAKLFNLTQPQVAYFGQKDAQQVVVLQHLARDLNFPLHIAVCPTVREHDGLAMSSRNRYLNPEERAAAASIPKALRAAADAYEGGERRPEALRRAVRGVLEAVPGAEIDYIALNDPRTLRGIIEPTERPVLLSLVVKIGRPRLLDNALLPWALNNRESLTRLLGGESSLTEH